MGGSVVSVDERIRKAIGAGNLQGYKALLVEKRALLIDLPAYNQMVARTAQLEALLGTEAQRPEQSAKEAASNPGTSMARTRQEVEHDIRRGFIVGHAEFYEFLFIESEVLKAAAVIAGVRERLDSLEARWREHEKQLAEEAEQASWELVNAGKESFVHGVRRRTGRSRDNMGCVV